MGWRENNEARYIICDLDGTLCDVDHRRHYVEGEVKNWTAFNDDLLYDAPFKHIRDMLKLYHNAGYKIVFITGRRGDDRTIDLTKTWLSHNIDFEYDIYFRPNNDWRPDHVIKLEIVKHRFFTPKNVEFVLDDRDSVVAMWRENGFMCLQVAPGAF